MSKSGTIHKSDIHPAYVILAVAIVYTVSGKLGLMLAIPPGYSTAIFPASGIALAATLLWGWRGAAGAWFGSFSINIWTSLSTGHDLTLASLFVPSFIATGALVQAFFGAMLIRRVVGFPTALDRERDIALFIVLGGPVSCVVSATFGVTTLWGVGTIPGQSFLTNWGNWWLGDTLGVVVAAPIVLTLYAQPRIAWARRRLALIASMFTLLTVVITIYVMASRWEAHRIDADFKNSARQVTFALLQALDKHSNVLDSIARFYSSSNFVDHSEFRHFTAPFVLHDPSFRALGWIPLITTETREEFETETQKSGFTKFQIWEKDETGHLSRASDRNTYFPVTYVEPWDRNEIVHGFDLGSEPVQRAAIDKAIVTGQPTVTGRVNLMQNAAQGDDNGLFLFHPIYKKGVASASTPVPTLDGFVLDVLNLHEIIKDILKPSEAMILVFELLDMDSGEGQRLLYPQQPVTRDTVPYLDYRHSLEFGGRRWEAYFTPTAIYMKRQRTWQAWAVLVTGLLFTALMGTYLLLVTGRWSRVESLVEERTRELEDANRRILKHDKLLAASQDLLSEAQRIAHVGHWDWNTRTNDLEWSEETYRINGLEPGTIKPTHDYFIATVHPDDRTRVLAEIKGTLIENHPYRTEYRLVRPSGEIRWVVGAAELQRDADNQPLRMVGVVLDVTNRKKSELELVSARIEADRANKAKSEFLSSMSHELRTPMNAILGYAQLLSYDTSINEKNRAQLGHIQQAGDHLLNLINDVLDFSRIEAGSMSVFYEDIEMGSMLREVRSLIQPAAKTRRVSVSVDEATGTNVVVHADRTRLKQIILNLLSNAVKYNRTDGEADLRCEVASDHIKILVRDTGKGLSLEQQQQLFQPFNRLGQERGEIEGTGIGLVITRRLIELMGGTLGLKSTPGVGSTFWIDLPCTVRAELPIETQSTIDLVKLLKARHLVRRVLCVEDNPANMDLVRSVIMSFWPKVKLIEAVTGEIGVAEAIREQPDLVLMDINLPGIDGFEALKRIQMSDLTRNLPVYALTANAVPEEIQRGLDAGFTGYITKPLDLPHFVRLVDEVLAKSVSAPLPTSRSTPISRRILVVDDDSINVIVLCTLVRALGYETDECSNGLEALERIQQVDYGLVFMDCEMPVMTGYEATRAVRQLLTPAANVPIIAVSANTPSEDLAERERAGFTSQMPKPVNGTTLSEVLDRYLGQNPPKTIPAPITTVGNEPALNPKMLVQMHQLLGAKTISIINTFLSDVPARLERMRIALDKSDFDTVQREAHALKGSASNLGAVSFSQLCALINSKCKHGQSHDLQSMYAQAVEEFESQLRPALNEFKHNVIQTKEFV